MEMVCYAAVILLCSYAEVSSIDDRELPVARTKVADASSHPMKIQ